MLDINDYYIGVLLASPDYYSDNRRFRMFQDVSFDPFQNISVIQSFFSGVPTLLRRDGDKYYDEYYSRWRNEISYHLGKPNDLGITLAHVKPFSECYQEDAVFYIQEDIEDDYWTLEELLLTRSYYITHSKLMNTDAIVILDEEKMVDVIYEYLRSTLGDELFQELCNKKFVKK